MGFAHCRRPRISPGADPEHGGVAKVAKREAKGFQKGAPGLGARPRMEQGPEVFWNPLGLPFGHLGHSSGTHGPQKGPKKAPKRGPKGSQEEV